MPAFGPVWNTCEGLLSETMEEAEKGYRGQHRCRGNLPDELPHALPAFIRCFSGIAMTEKVLAELFLFRAWTTQYAYRMFAHASTHDAFITETVSSCKYLGIGLFEKASGFSIERKLGDEFIELIESRWWHYDEVVVENKNSDTTIPARELCGKVCSFAEVVDPEVFVKLCADLLSQVRVTRDNGIAKDMFKLGRR